MDREYQKLYRIPEDGVIAGVCAGLAEYMDIDVTLLRVIFVILVFINGAGLIIYLVLAIVAPVKHSQDTEQQQNVADGRGREGNGSPQQAGAKHGRPRTELRNYVGLAVILTGVWLFMNQVYPGWISIDWSYIWPLLLIIAGGLILYRPASRKEQ